MHVCVSLNVIVERNENFDAIFKIDSILLKLVAIESSYCIIKVSFSITFLIPEVFWSDFRLEL